MFNSKKNKQITMNDIVETHDTIILNVMSMKDFKDNTLSLSEFNTDKGINAFLGKLKKDESNKIQAYYFDTDKWDKESVLNWYNKEILNELSNDVTFIELDNNIDGYELIFDELSYRDYVSQMMERFTFMKLTIDDFPFAEKGTSKEMAKNYNPKIYEAPLMLDHGRNDNYYDKAMGWIKSLKAVGTKLYAKIDNLTPEGREMLSNQYYKYKSVGMDILTNVGKYLFELSLTNQPALPNLGAVRLSRSTNGIDRDMYIYTLSNNKNQINDINGGLDMAQNDFNALLSENEDLKAKLSRSEDMVKQKDLLIEQLQANQKAFEKQLRMSNVTKKVELWLQEGKIIPAVYEEFGGKDKYIEHLSNMNDESIETLERMFKAQDKNPLLSMSLPESETLIPTKTEYSNPNGAKYYQILDYGRLHKINVDTKEGIAEAIQLWKKDKEGGI